MREKKPLDVFSEKTRHYLREQIVRPIAICVCRNRGRILVAEFREMERVYYRPLGGTIEFGERGEQTVEREFHEEIGTGLTKVRYLGTLENIYMHGRLRGHEIVLVYDGRLSDSRLYKKESLQGDELGHPFIAVWKHLADFGSGKPPVYPDGLLELLAR
jgi:8-oxo-dGTP pyrophosphatase MutT (NUDIX family)